jgi:hypothetical protein
MAPQSVARGSRGAGSSSGGDARPRQVHTGCQQPATGSHLPLEDTALPFAVAPFASSPFAHPIPHSRRRASGDLFSGSLSTRRQIPRLMRARIRLLWNNNRC